MGEAKQWRCEAAYPLDVDSVEDADNAVEEVVGQNPPMAVLARHGPGAMILSVIRIGN